MFIRVQEEDLVIGTKYKISVLPDAICNLAEFYVYSGVFKKSTTYPEKAYTSLEFEHLYNYLKEQKCRTKTCLVSDLYRYYVFISDQPQWKMERRAVNLIVRRLIGDDNFEW